MEKASFCNLLVMPSGDAMWSSRPHGLNEVEPDYKLKCDEFRHYSLVVESGVHLLRKLYNSNDGNGG